MALLTPHLPDTCSTYYELLGLPPVEGDLRAIDTRAKELMREARKYQVGRFANQAEKHLNLLAEARGCLLDPKRKIKYDEKLRGDWQLPPVSTMSTYPESEPASQFPDFSSVDIPLRSRAVASRARRNRMITLTLAVLGTVLLCSVLGVLGVWLLASRSAGGALPLNEALRQVMHGAPADEPIEDRPGEK